MIPAVILPVVRRAILDLLTEIGGEHNHATITTLLSAAGHRVAERDIAVELEWLGAQDLVHVEDLGPYKVARVLTDGRAVADGRLTIDGVSPHKTGD